MPKYTITLAFEVPCYAALTVEAPSRTEAVEQAYEDAVGVVFEPEWDLSYPGACKGDLHNNTYRVVDIEEEGR